MMAVTFNFQRNCFDYVELTMPSDVLGVVLEACSTIRDVLNCSQTCKQWNAITQDPAAYGMLWQRLYQRHFSLFGEVPKGVHPLESFKEIHVYNANFRGGIYARKKLPSSTVTNFTIAGDTLIVCSNVVQTWDLRTFKCLKTLPAPPHSGFAMANDRLVSVPSFEPETLEIWNLESQKQQSVLKGHAAQVTCFIWRNNRILSGSLDRTLRVWEIESGKCLHTLEHPESVHSLNEHRGRLVAGCKNGVIKVWNLETGECLKTLEVFTTAVSQLVFANEICVACSSTDKKMKALDLETGCCLKDWQMTFQPKKLCFINNNCIFEHGGTYGDILLYSKDLDRDKSWRGISAGSGFTGVFSFWKDKLITAHGNGIKIRDYHASEDAIFAEFANELSVVCKENEYNFVNRFCRMRPRAKEAIYQELQELLDIQTPLSENQQHRLFFNTLDGYHSTPEQQAQAIYNYLAKKGAHIPLTVRFDTGYGNSLVLCGKGGGLSWDPAQALPLKCEGKDKWTLRLALGTEQYKLLLKTKRGQLQWEQGENRQVSSQEPICIETPKF